MRCIEDEEDSEEDNEELDIFICPKSINDFRSVQEREIECRVLKVPRCGRVKLRSSLQLEIKPTFLLTEPILISVHANLECQIYVMTCKSCCIRERATEYLQQHRECVRISKHIETDSLQGRRQKRSLRDDICREG